jgi:hypothetical protein
MSVYLLVKRHATENNFQQLLGVYSSWETARHFFAQRFELNREPFTGSVLQYRDKEMLEYATAQMDSHQHSICLFRNGVIAVNVERVPVDVALAVN